MTPEHKALVAKLRDNVGRLTEEDCTAAASAIESLSAQPAQPQVGEPVAWLRDAHKGIEDECLVPAAAGDPGAFPVYASPQPANPVQVTELIEEAKDFTERMTGQPWACELVERLIDALTAAIGAGGQAVACKECDGTGFKDKNGARLTLARTPCGACGGSGNVAALSQPHPAYERGVEALPQTIRDQEIQWAVGRWRAEVENRPLVNIHRRSLDDSWRQVIRHFGGDPEALCGPAHDELLDLSATEGR